MTKAWSPSASAAILAKRSELLWQIRRYFHEQGVIELQTAVLAKYGVTDPHIASVAVPGYGYLQSSPEYQMKRALAAGVGSCYQICPAFREGEAGRWHNPEFVMLEWYRLGFDKDSLMLDVQALVDMILGTATYQTLTMRELLTDCFDIDPFDCTTEEVRQKAEERGLIATNDSASSLDYLVSKAMEELGSGRFFITDYLASEASLARVSERNGRLVAERFELLVDGIELANGFDELRDAVELRQRMTRDNERRHQLGLPQMNFDERLLDAMAVGLPACAGVAIGLDRLFALALDQHSIQDVMSFPWDRA